MAPAQDVPMKRDSTLWMFDLRRPTRMKRLHIALLIAFISTIAGLGQDATASSAPSAPEPQSSQQPPPPHVGDLKSADGTILKGTYFAAANPGPGVVLLHQINRDRKSWVP